MVEVISDQIEAPQVLYPRGPIRKAITWDIVRDALIGEVIAVKLECGHSATLIGSYLNKEMTIIKCSYCRYERERQTHDVLEVK
jgi:hypothetical protein